MAERDSSSVDVDLRGVESSLLDHDQSLRSEGFVQFDQINLVQSQSGKFQRLGNRIYRADAHDFGRATGGREADETSERLDAEFPSTLF